jgi:hypothetical protein
MIESKLAVIKWLWLLQECTCFSRVMWSFSLIVQSLLSQRTPFTRISKISQRNSQIGIDVKFRVFNAGLLARSQFASGRSCDRPTQSKLSLVFIVPTWYSSFTMPSKLKWTPWLQSASELYRPNGHRLSAKLIPNSTDRGCRVVSATDPHGR